MANPTQLRDVYDLRSALRVLEAHPGQLLRTKTPVDPNAELAGVSLAQSMDLFSTSKPVNSRKVTQSNDCRCDNH